MKFPARVCQQKFTCLMVSEIKEVKGTNIKNDNLFLYFISDLCVGFFFLCQIPVWTMATDLFVVSEI
jgi:hypothetical protein